MNQKQVLDKKFYTQFKKPYHFTLISLNKKIITELENSKKKFKKPKKNQSLLKYKKWVIIKNTYR